MVLTIDKWFKSHRIYINPKATYHVFCVDNGYQPHFNKGTYYKVETDVRENESVTRILSPKYNIKRMDDHSINKLFIPLEGKPSKLSMRDKLMIEIRYKNVKKED
ncbi:MAG: hypothetical protein SLAVMIC_00948 [uncultured marine phage]|uniref:Uncharacterized protein n=1 Tax=uncultured marine phage TaxID=707152 RepID=A0A8D9C9U2_9VIRU|nr:MAG: hypothetical protein SLAVMIC_00948 [uncultured marine phage]